MEISLTTATTMVQDYKTVLLDGISSFGVDIADLNELLSTDIDRVRIYPALNGDGKFTLVIIGEKKDEHDNYIVMHDGITYKVYDNCEPCPMDCPATGDLAA